MQKKQLLLAGNDILLACLFLHSLYHQHPVTLQKQVAVFVTKEIHVAFFVSVLVGEVLKIVTGVCQFLPWAFTHFLARSYLPLQDAAVAAQHGIYFFNNRCILRLQLVVVLGAAVVVAKFFINTAF
jgi:uncharacterized membrane protein